MIKKFLDLPDFLNFICKMYTRYTGDRLILIIDDYKDKLEDLVNRYWKTKPSDSFWFIKDIICFLEENDNNLPRDENYENLRLYLTDLVKSIKTILDLKPPQRVSLLVQIQAEGYSYDFSAFPGMENSILYS